MAKKRAVPDATSRTSYAFWEKMIDASNKRRHAVNVQSARFMRWHRGDLRDVVDPATILDTPLRWQSSMENMHSLVVQASLADLMFRYPRINIKPSYVSPSMPAMMGMPSPIPNLFTPGLARCETRYLEHSMQRTRYLRRARRSLQDALVADMGILKLYADPDVVIDEETLEEAQGEAMLEVRAFLQHGVKMKAREDQIHSVHVRVWSNILRQADKGQPALPTAAKKYIRKHIAVHESMKRSERPTETIKSCEIRLLRVNPLDYFYDPTVDDRENASWRGHRYLKRRADVLGNENYNEDARTMVQNAQDRWVNTNFLPAVKTPGSFDVPEEMVMVYEIYDLVDQRIRLFADGVEIALLDEERGDLGTIQPSGPFHEIVFIEDSMEGQGIPPACSYEGEQAAATHIASANVAAAIQSSPRTMYDMRNIDPEQAQRIWKSNTAEFIGIEKKGDFDKPLENSFAQIPIVEIPAQNLLVKQDAVHGIERRSGLGVAKTMGGEQSATATGAALGADAAAALSEDRGALVDAWQTDIARDWISQIRAFVPKSQIVEICGDEAITSWPDPPHGSMRSFSTVDVCNHVGVGVVPGSSRRHNTNVDQKQLLDQVDSMAADPSLQGPAAVKLRLQMRRAAAEDSGLTGFDWEAVEQELTPPPMMPQIDPETGQPLQGDPNALGGAQGGPGAGLGAPVLAGPGAASGDPRASRGQGAGPAAQNDISQGVANSGAGGGQIATGASTGDKMRAYRGQALGNIRGRK